MPNELCNGCYHLKRDTRLYLVGVLKKRLRLCKNCAATRHITPANKQVTTRKTT